MKIVLLKNVEKLGKEGDLCQVKDGYGRNYLIPSKLALAATKANLRKVEELKQNQKKQVEKEKESVGQIKEKIDNLSLTVTAEAKEDESLYGSISAMQLQRLLQDEGIELSKDKILLPEAINKLGVYKIPVKITKDSESVFRLWVVKK